jgi:aminoglycoside/choline kinase family phosphotransferase
MSLIKNARYRNPKKQTRNILHLQPMQKLIADIQTLYENYFKHPIVAIDKIPESGSDRMYFRVKSKYHTCIATYSDNVKESNTFIHFAHHFKTKNGPVPLVYTINEEETIYLQEDFGDTSLLHEIELQGHNSYVYLLFKKSLKALAQLQIVGGESIDYSLCLTAKEFGQQAIVSDLLYFKYYFLDTLKFPYDKQALIAEFDALSNYLAHTETKHFMFRDFQSRNIMVQQDKVHFIDFQGGMKGALQYDVASLLWQAKADLPEQWKNDLLDFYIEEASALLEQPLDKVNFIAQYNGYVLIRLLQVLGAYGFRGLFERKAHFLTSIPLALKNLHWFIENRRMGISVPTFEKCLQHCVSEEVIKRFEPLQATDATLLVVTINSFSYKKGIPPDSTENGGGFVFDCRSILNPGRFDEYKKQSGLDKEVKEFLDQQTEMPSFLNSVFDIVDIAVTDYIKRNFSSLMVNFGCTGGQHRSVYAAEALARHLRNKFKVTTVLTHTNEGNWKGD